MNLFGRYPFASSILISRCAHLYRRHGPLHLNWTRHFASEKERTVVYELSQGRTNVYDVSTSSSRPQLINEPSPNNTSLSSFRFVQKVKQVLRSAFLPAGYPTSVHSSYFPIHFWQFIESALGSCISVFVAQALLTSVGAAGSIPSHSTESAVVAGSVAVAIQWVLKDSIGEMGKLIFIQQFASSFDSHPKLWKMMGEMVSVAGAFVQLSTVLVPNPQDWFLALASFGMILRGIHFSIWAATHTTFTRHFATNNGANVGDIVAKDDAQFAVSHLVGMIIGVTLLAYAGPSTISIFSLVACMGLGQLFCTFRLVKAASFECLNEPRMRLLCHHYTVDREIPSFQSFSKTEPWFGEHIPKRHEEKLNMARLRLDVPMQNIPWTSLKLQPLESFHVFLNEAFVVFENHNGYFYGLLKTSANSTDVLKLYLICAKLSVMNHETRRQLEQVLDSVNREFPAFVKELQLKGWDTNTIGWKDTGIRIR